MWFDIISWLDIFLSWFLKGVVQMNGMSFIGTEMISQTTQYATNYTVCHDISHTTKNQIQRNEKAMYSSPFHLSLWHWHYPLSSFLVTFTLSPFIWIKLCVSVVMQVFMPTLRFSLFFFFSFFFFLFFFFFLKFKPRKISYAQTADAQKDK